MKASLWLFGLPLILSVAAIAFARRSAGRVEELERKIDALNARVERKSEAARTDAPLPSSAPAAPEEPPPAVSVPSRAPERKPDAVTLDRTVEEKVRKAMEEERREERESRTGWWARASAARRARQMERYTKELGLTEYQKTEIARIWEEADGKIRALFSATFESHGGEREAADPEKMHEQARTIRREADESVRPFLTPQQYEAYAKLQEERRDRPPAFLLGD